MNQALQTSPQALLSAVRENIIGQYQPLATPFGVRPLVYADYTASGRALRFIEAQLQERVLPYYANTHSESSLTGAQTTALREQSRAIIASAIGCSAQDRLIFCGSGATAAINKLIDILNLRLPAGLDEEQGFSAQISQEQRPVVFIGPYEHHSNELPWRESIADVISIPLDEQGQIDQAALAAALDKYAARPLRIGSFSAASNVTGICSDVVGITQTLKNAGALAFWDYAAAGPYLGIDMNCPNAAIDAVFLSPHKFIGGPGTPGILAVKAALLNNRVPASVGGGTVAYVSPTGHRYLDDLERREEAGTPGIVESIRAGLVFGLQQAIGTDTIEDLEATKVAKVMQRLGQRKNIHILGPVDATRLAIFSLRFPMSDLPGDRELHYGYVAALLNDLFGIQARGGCSCAGPYGHLLLDLSTARSEAIEQQISRGCGALRPGWLRLNFNYFICDAEFDYLLEALELIAEHAWRLLPAYRLDVQSGLWRHRDGARVLPVQLDPLATTAGGPGSLISTSAERPNFGTLLQEARRILNNGATPEQRASAAADAPLDPAAEQLRWFMLPNDSVPAR